MTTKQDLISKLKEQLSITRWTKGRTYHYWYLHTNDYFYSTKVHQDCIPLKFTI